MSFEVRLYPPRNKPELDLVLEVARFNGDGYYRGGAGVVLHRVSEHGLQKLERGLPGRICRVTLDTAPPAGGVHMSWT